MDDLTLPSCHLVPAPDGKQIIVQYVQRDESHWDQYLLLKDGGWFKYSGYDLLPVDTACLVDATPDWTP